MLDECFSFIKEMGVIVMGKIESGCCRVGDRCLIMPNRTRVEVTNIYYEDIETDSCVCGENVRLKLKNVEEEVRLTKSQPLNCFNR